MGIQIPVDAEDVDLAAMSENWPRILLVGPPNVGKQTVLRRLLAMGKVKGPSFSASGLSCHGWTIDTKYYSVDVCISAARLTDDESQERLKSYVQSNQCQALVFIFDLSNLLTFEQIKECIVKMDLKHVEILLCVGNKADRLPGHFGHAEYRRRLQKRGESSSDPHPEFWDFGIQQSDGSSLLEGDGESLDELRSQCIEWCADNGIEYLEACAVDHVFDQCISVDGDSQGVSRIWGALSAHMWPGLMLKDERNPSTPPLPNGEDESSEDGSVVIEYERLSNGSIELWDDDNGPWSFYESTHIEVEEQTDSDNLPNGRSIQPPFHETHNGSSEPVSHVTSTVNDTAVRDPDNSRSEDIVSESAVLQRQDDGLPSSPIINGHNDDDDDHHHASVQRPPRDQEHENGRSNPLENGRRSQERAFNDFEQLMQEMARVRENASRVPDSQRREMAATLALRMASMFDEDD